MTNFELYIYIFGQAKHLFSKWYFGKYWVHHKWNFKSGGVLLGRNLIFIVRLQPY